MFFRKKKQNETRDTKSETRDNKRVAKEVLFGLVDPVEEETTKPIKIKQEKNNDQQIETKEVDKNEFDSNQVKEIKKEEPVDENNELEEVQEDTLQKQQQLYNFFEEHKANESKLKKSNQKKRITKRESKKQREYLEIKSKRVYKYKKQRYKKIEDFISFLNEQYLDLDEIATSVLADDAFLGWLQKKSGVFEQSIDEFRAIKQKIETK